MISTEHVARYAELPLPVEAELGTCTLSVREILSLSPGSVIKLSNPVGSKVALYIGGAPLGSGEMIKIGKSTAVKLTTFATRKRD